MNVKEMQILLFIKYIKKPSPFQEIDQDSVN